MGGQIAIGKYKKSKQKSNLDFFLDFWLEKLI